MGSKLVGALAALSIFGSVAWASTTGPPQNGGGAKGSGYGYGAGKVTICHRTGSRTNPTVTITVSRNALKAHLSHGDTIGAC